MLNNTGTAQNDAFQGLNNFSQFTQPGMASSMNNTQSNYQKRPGGAPMMQPGVQSGLGNARQQHQRSAAGNSLPQHFPGQYGPNQRGDASHMGVTNNLLTNLGGLRQGPGSAVPSQFPSLQPPAGRAGNGLNAANALGSIRNAGQKQRMGGVVNMDGFVSHSQAMPQPGIGFAHRPNAMDARSAQASLLHSISQSGKTNVPNGHISNSSMPLDYAKKGVMHGAHPQHMSTYVRPAMRAQSGAVQQQINSDKEGVLNASDFPVLGGMSDAPSGADGFPGPAYAHQLAAAKKERPDATDFPALSASVMSSLAGSMGHLGLGGMQVGARPGIDGPGKSAAHTPPPEAEKFGLKGLLPLVRMEDPERSFVALGIDLQTLGLNLNASASLYSTLQSPFQVGGRPGALDQPLPQCYLFEAQALTATSLKRFTNMTVFYVFYVFAGEEKQLLAADELIRRGWVFHKSLTMWMRPDKTSEIEVSGVPGEQGIFDVFDPNSWSIQKKENFFMDHRFIEEAPSQRLP